MTQNSLTKKIKKKSLSFVQVNFSVGPKDKNAYYLPYSVGVLWEYCKKLGLDESYELKEVIWRRDGTSEVAEILKGTDVVCFSNYIWNKSYNYDLASKVKKGSPDTLIIFGGPETPVTRKNVFVEFPFIDLIVKKEGEVVFSEVLKKIQKFPSIDVEGILVNDNSRCIDTGESARIDKLEDIPSPYLSGFFDSMMKMNPDIEWNMTLETDRGCPFACTFCDWGSLTYNKVRKFELGRVFDEIEWAGKNKIGFMSMTNANFGMFAERDSAIVDKILEVQERYGFPYTFSTAWAKNQRKDVITLVKKLIDSKFGFNQGLTVSVQSMDQGVLTAIKRKNMAINNLSEVFKECELQNVPAYTELILGLPGETLSSFKQNFYTLFELGNHTGITVFQAQLLENAEMNLLQRKLYNIESATVYDYMEGNLNDGDIKEGVDIVVSTRDMPRSDMLDAQVWSWFITTFHIGGLSSFISRVLVKCGACTYSEFYEGLFNYIKNDDWWRTELTDTQEYYLQWMNDGEIHHPIIEGVGILGWNLIYRSMANIMIHDKYEHTFDMLRNFTDHAFGIEDTLLDQLISFQSNYFIRFSKIHSYPTVVNYDWDFYHFCQDEGPLGKNVSVTFDFLENKDMSKAEFIKKLYFFRRRNFGKAWITVN